MRISRLAWTAGVATLSLAAAVSAADRSAPRARRKAAPEAAPAAAPPATTPAADVHVHPAAPAPASAPAAVTPVMTMTPTAAPGTPAPAPAGPPGKAEIKELLFDAGTVERGAEIKHDFVIKSIGDNDLTVDAKPG